MNVYIRPLDVGTLLFYGGLTMTKSSRIGIALALSTASFITVVATSSIATASEDILFSTSSSINQSAIERRDRTRPFFFAINTLPQNALLPFTVDIGSDFQVWLDRRLSNPNVSNSLDARSLALQLNSVLNDNVKDKIFFDAIPWNESGHMTVSGPHNERFFSFDMNLASPYTTPKYWVIHFQAWQCCSGHPPLVLQVIPEESNQEKIALQLSIRNDETENIKYGQEVQIAKFFTARDCWFHVALDIEPAIIGSSAGKVSAWLNGQPIVTWQGQWGYAPNPKSKVSHGEISEKIGLDIGIYRRRQPGTQTVLINNVKYGDTIKDIDIR